MKTKSPLYDIKRQSNGEIQFWFLTNACFAAGELDWIITDMGIFDRGEDGLFHERAMMGRN
jgi:hypothetical protein